MWITAIVLGFAGSMHCLGMCSPLVVAVTSMRPAAMLNRINYNAGRIVTYAIVGAIVAGIGQFLPFQKYQQVFSAGLGITLLVIGIGGVRTVKVPGLTAALMRSTSRLKTLFAQAMTQRSATAMFVTGALNGLLPCGLTFMALTWCITLRGPVDGFKFMLLFGVGTLPVMLGFTRFVPIIAKKMKISLHHLTTGMLIVSGCVLILRGLGTYAAHDSSTTADLVDMILCR